MAAWKEVGLIGEHGRVGLRVRGTWAAFGGVCGCTLQFLLISVK